MKPNELMLGDWVTFKDCQFDNPMPIKMIAIGYQDGEENCLVQINGDDACDIIAIDDEIVGIPLTPEILEKNGFTRPNVRVQYFTESTDYYDVDIHEITDSIWCFEYQNCKAHFPPCLILIAHVHELQHALRLCGIEKEITI